MATVKDIICDCCHQEFTNLWDIVAGCLEDQVLCYECRLALLDKDNKYLTMTCVPLEVVDGGVKETPGVRLIRARMSKKGLRSSSPRSARSSSQLRVAK